LDQGVEAWIWLWAEAVATIVAFAANDLGKQAVVYPVVEQMVQAAALRKVWAAQLLEPNYCERPTASSIPKLSIEFQPQS
jgi:hypothetical protein